MTGMLGVKEGMEVSPSLNGREKPLRCHNNSQRNHCLVKRYSAYFTYLKLSRLLWDRMSFGHVLQFTDIETEACGTQ